MEMGIKILKWENCIWEKLFSTINLFMVKIKNEAFFTVLSAIVVKKDAWLEMEVGIQFLSIELCKLVFYLLIFSVFRNLFVYGSLMKILMMAKFSRA